MQDATSSELKDRIVQLHDIARAVEQEIGVGQLSEDIRKAADRLHRIVYPVAVQELFYQAVAEQIDLEIKLVKES